MILTNKINEDLKDAMRAKDKVALEAVRAVKAAFLLAKTQEGGSDGLTDDEEIKIIQKLVKQRTEAAAIYKEQSRDDLYQKEMDEAKVLEKYLPARMDSAEIRVCLHALIAKLGASGMKDMGKVMGVASKELAGKADGKEIAALVKELLG